MAEDNKRAFRKGQAVTTKTQGAGFVLGQQETEASGVKQTLLVVLVPPANPNGTALKGSSLPEDLRPVMSPEGLTSLFKLMTEKQPQKPSSRSWKS